MTSPSSGEEAIASLKGGEVDLGAGWKSVLDQMDVRDRAYLSVARPELEGSLLVLWFAYSFHQQKAKENASRVESAVADWLGAGTSVDFRLQESTGGGGSAAAQARPKAPEEHEIVQRAVRQLEGRVTKVSVPKETRP
jgi:hypothetical protein